MEIQIKRTVRAGNSSAVVLPKAWLNREVRIELVRKTDEIILKEIIELLEDKIPLEEVIGIYIVGSYARGEETAESDIDILVITDGVEHASIELGAYSIMIVSSRSLKYKLENDLLPIGSMIMEAKPLLNANYLKGIIVNASKKNVDWYVRTTDDKLKLARRALNKLKNVEYAPSELVYTLVLRIRTLLMIKGIISKKIYSKKRFVDLIQKISGGKGAYSDYSAVKNNSRKYHKTTINETEKIYNYLEKELNSVKKMLN
jgi:predicted nucleotidyltransferase